MVIAMEGEEAHTDTHARTALHSAMTTTWLSSWETCVHTYAQVSQRHHSTQREGGEGGERGRGRRGERERGEREGRGRGERGGEGGGQHQYSAH